MKMWLDDIRPMPFDFDVHVKTAHNAILLLKTGLVAEVSLDHDLGDIDHLGMPTGTGKHVADFIEESAYNGTLSRMKWNVHSANPVGAAAMKKALQNADRFWKKGLYG